MYFVTKLECTWEVPDLLVHVDILDLFCSSLLATEVVHIEWWIFFHEMPKKRSCVFFPIGLHFSLLEEWKACTLDCFWIARSTFLLAVSNWKQGCHNFFLTHSTNPFGIWNFLFIRVFWVSEVDSRWPVLKDWFYDVDLFGDFRRLRNLSYNPFQLINKFLFGLFRYLWIKFLSQLIRFLGKLLGEWDLWQLCLCHKFFNTCDMFFFSLSRNKD